MAKTKNKVVIIGAGKIAWSIAAALNNADIEIVSIISRTEKSARLLAKRFGVKNFSASLKNVPPEATIYLLSVPDSEIETLADKISGLKEDLSGKIFLHFSGVESSGSLNKLSVKGGATGSLHIMQTFPSREIIDIKNCNAAVEAGDFKTKQFITRLARSIGLKPFSISPQEKILYHITGVLASNFLTGNYFAAEFLSGKSFKPSIILPGITLKALNNIISKGAVNSLSGPVERGDFQTVRKHIYALTSFNGRQKKGTSVLLSYLSQSLVLIDIMKAKNGLLSAGQIKIKRMLISELKKASTRY